MSGRPGRKPKGGGQWAVTSNAADPKQLRAAERAVKRWEGDALNDMRVCLRSPECRRVLWRLMYEARTSFAHAHEAFPHLTASVWDNSAAIHYNSGRQDLGLLLQGWVQQADRNALLLIMQEALQRDLQREAEITAAHTASVLTEDNPNGE